MFFNLIRSEWLKLSTTKAIYWLTIFYFALSAGLAWVTGKYTTMDKPPFVLIAPALQPITTLTIVFPAILAMMVVTGEYRHRTMSSTFTAAPQRVAVIFAKLVVALLYAALTTVVVVLAAFYAYKLGVGSDYQMMVDPFVPWARHAYFSFAAGAALFSLFAFGLGLLLRQTAGTSTLLIIWYFVLEPLLTLLPKVGEFLYKWAPMHHMQAFMQDKATGDFSATQSGLYATAFGVVIFLIGLVYVVRRDA